MVPPSREAWIWQVACAAAERMQQFGSELEDIGIAVADIGGAFRVTIGDTNLGSNRNPARLAEGSMPVAGSADRLRDDIRAALAAELARLREPPAHWREQLAADLAVWAKRVGVDVASMQLRLDVAEDECVMLCVDDGEAADVLQLALPTGVAHVDLAGLAAAARDAMALHASAVRH